MSCWKMVFQVVITGSTSKYNFLFATIFYIIQIYEDISRTPFHYYQFMLRRNALAPLLNSNVLPSYIIWLNPIFLLNGQLINITFSLSSFPLHALRLWGITVCVFHIYVYKCVNYVYLWYSCLQNTYFHAYPSKLWYLYLCCMSMQES